MTFIDLAIIYLACGAPLSVHFFFGARKRSRSDLAARVVLVILFWPAAAFLLFRTIRRRRALQLQSSQNDLERFLDSKRLDIERSMFSNENAAALFEFRELFARYTGLAQAANAGVSEICENELLKLSSHPRCDLGAICLERKAKNRLLSHADAAAEDFVSFIALANIDSDAGLLSSAKSLAETLGDHKTVSRLRDLESHGGYSVATKVGATPVIHAVIN